MTATSHRWCRGIGAAVAVTVIAGALAEPLPKPGPAPTVNLPTKTDFALENGLKVTLIPFGTVPKSTLVMTLATGSVADGDRHGAAHLAAELIQQGIRGGDANALHESAADLGGELGVAVGVDRITLSMDVLSEHAADAVDLMAGVLRAPTLPVRELARLKADLKRSISISHSQQQGLAGEAFAQALYGDAPRGRRLQEQDVDALGIDDVRGFVRDELSAGRAHVYVAGRFDDVVVSTAIRRAFSDWTPGSPPVLDPSVPKAQRVVRLVDRPGAKQSTVLMGIPVRSIHADGFTGLSLANAILGGAGLLSRLDQNLREDKGWTYGVQSSLQTYAANGLWVLQADINTPDTAAAIGAIFSELHRLTVSPPDDEELRQVRNYRAGHFLMGASSRAGVLGQVEFVDQFDLPPEWLSGYLQRMEAVSPDAVRHAASELDPSRMTLVVTGDVSKIKSGIEGIEALHGADFR